MVVEEAPLVVSLSLKPYSARYIPKLYDRTTSEILRWNENVILLGNGLDMLGFRALENRHMLASTGFSESHKSICHS